MEIKKINVINPNEYGSLLYNEKENTALLNVMEERRIFRYSRTKYPYVKMFEEEISKKVNSKYCLGITSGTAGLITALKAINIKPNDKVLVSSYTYIATALAVKIVGGIPIPLNIDLKNGIDIEDLKEKIDISSCKAVIITHLQGRCFNLKKVCDVIKKKNLYLIEDACQGFASNCNNIYAGTYGDIGVYSFQQFKQISAGEGGAIVTNNEELYERARNYTDMGSIRNRFPSWNSDRCLIGQNYRMNNLTGGILYEQMKKLDNMIIKQKKSRKNILNIVKKHVVLEDNIIYSEDHEGDTGMNILVKVNANLNIHELIEDIKTKYNVEIRNMWNGLYFDNELFKNQKLADINFEGTNCDKTRDIVSKLFAVSIPPILTEENEENIAKALIYFIRNNI